MKYTYLIHKVKQLSLGILVLSMASCGFLGNDATKNGYTVKPNYEHPKFKELNEVFAKQEHRFELDRCEFKYNDQSFFMGDSYDKIIAVFGEPDSEPYLIPSKRIYYIKYKRLKLTFRFFPHNNVLESLNIEMSSHKGHEDTPYKVIKFRKVPYHLDMTLNEFTELCDLRHGESLGHRSSSFYIKNEKKCDKINVGISIGATPRYQINDLGGHMTTRGDFNQESSGPIKGFGVSLK